jgi:TonB-dependent SusC/RagA subfamily outer membrane receptor
VGYGTQEGEKVSGAVTSVSGDDIGENRGGGGGVAELLRGRVAGLQIIPRPEGGHSFRIRGVTTMAGQPPEPLFVVDGTQVSAEQIESALAGLTREDIRQVDVLKDVASTSVYGTRGVGGVIIINTKRR